MKLLKFTLLVLLLLFTACERWLDSSYSIHIKNNSEYTISSYFALGIEGRRGEGRTAFPDTTLSFDRQLVGYSTPPGALSRRAFSTFPPEWWFERLPQDTLSIFIFNQAVLNRYSWREIQQGYKILQRYDLSLDDLRKLHNRFDFPEIPFPPDERMRYMRMYPPFRTY